jgi:hypothetical protein
MIIVNLVKAKDIAHTLRREVRALEFQPYDDIIMKQIPGSNVAEAELARQQIREKYQQIQIDIDNAATLAEIQIIIDNMS